MSVRSFSDCLYSRAVVVRSYTFCDHLTGVVAKNPNSQELMCLWASHHLDYAFILVSDARSKVTLDIYDTLVVRGVALLKVFFRNSHPRYFWVCVDNTRDTIVVNTARAICNMIHYGNRLDFRLVNQHCSFNTISNAIDVGLFLDLPGVVCKNHSTIVCFNASFLKVHALSLWVSTN